MAKIRKRVRSHQDCNLSAKRNGDGAFGVLNEFRCQVKHFHLRSDCVPDLGKRMNEASLRLQMYALFS